MTISGDELAIRQRLKDDFPHYASRCLRIRSKSGAIEPLLLNKAQLYLHQKVEEQRAATGSVRIIGLKGRQQGFSTYVEGRAYWRVTHQKGFRAFILTHEEEATKNLFEMANRYHEHCPHLVRPHTGAANANELNFDLLDSGYKVGTARTKGTGRSSTIQFFHGSEVAHWPNAEEHAAGVMQAVPDEPGTEIFLESTANGIGNYYHRQWQKAEAGQSDYIAVFIPWYWQDEYQRDAADFTPSAEEQAYADFYGLTFNQLAWRRAKIVELGGELLFRQEYPATSAEAFQNTGTESFISPQTVMAARKGQANPTGPLIVGVDPARSTNGDRTSIAFRRGRKCTKVESHNKDDLMEVVALCSRIFQNFNPRLMVVDVVGIGSGVVDRLRELGYRDRVLAFNAGSTKVNNPEVYKNRRAEVWGEMREWLKEAPVQIPDSDSLHADLTGVGFKYDSNNRILLESKDDMKKRGLRSPDEADALAFTFAMPVSTEELPPLAQQEPDYFGVSV